MTREICLEDLYLIKNDLHVVCVFTQPRLCVKFSAEKIITASLHVIVNKESLYILHYSSK